MSDNVTIEAFDPSESNIIASLIRRNITPFQTAEPTLSATFRRIESLCSFYQAAGTQLFVARDPDSSYIIGCSGLGPLHGLPVSEGIGEIRDLVVEEQARGTGVGSKLLHRCIDEARRAGYQRLYLETSQNMIHARKLFLRSGFRPVNETTAFSDEMTSALPCYFLLESLRSA